MSRTYRHHGPDHLRDRDRKKIKRPMKSNKQRRSNERQALRKEYR